MTLPQEDTLGQFGPYLLLKKIACGGMAEIYLARPLSPDAEGRLLVVKRVLPQVSGDTTFLKMFKSEIRVCAGFNHPNIVQMFDFGQVDGQPYIAMEYVEGRPLHDLFNRQLDQNQLLPLNVTLSIVAKALLALQYAHTFQNRTTGTITPIIHRDVSPQNILVSYSGEVKLIDFGIAKSLSHTSEKTTLGRIKGKVGYLSPEQILGQELDSRVDVFAMGIVLWQLLAGQRLFYNATSSEFDIFQNIVRSDEMVKPPSSLNPAISPTLDQIVLKALSSDRAARYASAKEFHDALAPFIVDTSTHMASDDIAQLMSLAFANAIQEDRELLQTLTQNSQKHLRHADRGFEGSVALPTILTAKSRVNPFDKTSASIGYTAPPPPPLSIRKAQPISRPATQPIARPIAQPIAPPAAQPIVWAKPKKRLMTRERVLIALLYIITIWVIRMDQNYLFFERFFIPTDQVRMVTQSNSAKPRGADVKHFSVEAPPRSGK